MNTRLLTFIALFTITIGGIGVDLYSPSLPWIAQAMQVSNAFVKYTITTFLIGFALGQMAFGILSDIHGRRWVLFAGVLIFVITSLISAFSANIYMLMVMRCIQGFAAASCSVISKAILADALKGEALRKAMTSLGVAWAVGPIVAPVIGGYLQHHFNWQANFYFYAIYSFILLVSIFFFLKETSTTKIEAKVSTITCHYSSLFKHRVFILGTIQLGLGYSLIVAFNIMGPFLIQRTLHYGPVVFGHMALLIGFAFFLGNMLSRLFAKRFSPITVVKMGLVVILLFGIAYLIEAYYIPISLWTLVLPTFFIMTGVGLIFPNIMALCMSLFPQIAGIASSLLGCVLYVVTTIASAIFGFIVLPNQLPYAWTLIAVILVMSGIFLLGFFPAVRRLKNN